MASRYGEMLVTSSGHTPKNPYDTPDAATYSGWLNIAALMLIHVRDSLMRLSQLDKSDSGGGAKSLADLQDRFAKLQDQYLSLPNPLSVTESSQAIDAISEAVSVSLEASTLLEMADRSIEGFGVKAPPKQCKAPSTFPWWGWVIIAAGGAGLTYYVIRKRRQKSLSGAS